MALLQRPQIAVIVSYVVMVVVSIVAVVMRFLSVRRKQKQPSLPDWLCLLSLVCCVAYAIDTMIGTIAGGIGIHIDEVPADRLVLTLKTFFASQFFWAISITAFRLSTIFLYIEIFPKKAFRYCAYGMATIVCLFLIASITTSLRICKPIALTWDKSLPGTCGDIGTAEMAAAAINLVLDVVIVLLPMPVVWRLQMSQHKKIAVTVTFALGLGIAGVNLGRIIELLVCNVEDFTYCTANSAILTVAEMAVGIVACTVPTLGPLLFPSRYRSTGYSGQELRRGTHNTSGMSSGRGPFAKDSLSSSSTSDDFYPTAADKHDFLDRVADGRRHHYQVSSELDPTRTATLDRTSIGVHREVVVSTSDSWK